MSGSNPAEANIALTVLSDNRGLPSEFVCNALLIVGLKLANALAVISPPAILTNDSSIQSAIQSVPFSELGRTDIPKFANAEAVPILVEVVIPNKLPSNVSPVTSLAILILGSICCSKVFLYKDIPPSSTPSPRVSPVMALNHSFTGLPVLAAHFLALIAKDSPNSLTAPAFLPKIPFNTLSSNLLPNTIVEAIAAAPPAKPTFCAIPAAIVLRRKSPSLAFNFPSV